MKIEKNYALEQAITQANSIVRMVRAIECDYDRLQELRGQAKTPRFVAGWNMAGYMPDMDPSEFDNVDDAKRFIIHELKLDELEKENEQEAETLCAFAEEVNLENDEFSLNCLGIVYWVTEDGFIPLPEYDASELAELEEAANGCADQEEAQQAIQEDPLSIEVRSAWQTIGETLTPSEFCILLCAGSPAVRIVGELDEHLQPSRAWIEYQDWGTPWTHLVDCPASQDTLITYCQQFYFGE